MATADNFFVGMVDPTKARDLSDSGKHCGMDSQPTPDPTTIRPPPKYSS